MQARYQLPGATVLIALSIAVLPGPRAVAEKAIPRTIADLRKEWNPRTDPLETRVVRQWTDDGNLYRSVIYTVGTNTAIGNLLVLQDRFNLSCLPLPGKSTVVLPVIMRQ